MATPKGEKPKKCTRCLREPTKGSSFNCYNVVREGAFLVYYPVCTKCKLELNRKKEVHRG